MSSASSIVTFFLTSCQEFSSSGAQTTNKRAGHETRTNQRHADLFSGQPLTFLVPETHAGSGSSISGVSGTIIRRRDVYLAKTPDDLSEL